MDKNTYEHLIFSSLGQDLLKHKDDNDLKVLLDSIIEIFASDTNEKEVNVKTMDEGRFLCIFNKYHKLIKGLWKNKNRQYGDCGDVLKGIRENAERAYGSPTRCNMFDTVMKLKDKHDLALVRKGLDLQDAKERLYDIIVYSYLALAVMEADDEELFGKQKLPNN